jgi:hypothetical protein
MDQGKVAFFDQTAGELERQGAMGGLVLGHDDEPRCPPVQTVDDTRSGNVTDATQIRTMVKQCIDESARVVTRRRMHDHVGRFDDDQQIFVFMEDIQGDVFRLGLGRFRRRNFDFDPLSLMEVSRRTHRPTADADQTLFAPPLGLRAARSFDVGGEGSIDSHVFFLGLHDPAHDPIRSGGSGF